MATREQWNYPPISDAMPRLVDEEGAALILGVPVNWILEHGKELPSVKVGRYRRFLPESLIAWARTKEVTE